MQSCSKLFFWRFSNPNISRTPMDKHCRQNKEVQIRENQFEFSDWRYIKTWIRTHTTPCKPWIAPLKALSSHHDTKWLVLTYVPQCRLRPGSHCKPFVTLKIPPRRSPTALMLCVCIYISKIFRKLHWTVMFFELVLFSSAAKVA